MNSKSLLKLAALTLISASLTLASSMAFADGATNDTIACYKWDKFPNERLNVGIRRGGPLSSSADETNFNHPAQRTHGVHAKHVGVCGDGTNGAVEGVVTVASATGAHMGLHTTVSRGSERSGGSESCRPVFLECFSTEAEMAPQQWTCKSRNEFGIYHGESTLTLVALDTAPNDPLCAAFEDEDSFEKSERGKRGRRVVASGTKGSADKGERHHD